MLYDPSVGIRPWIVRARILRRRRAAHEQRSDLHKRRGALMLSAVAFDQWQGRQARRA
jgi:hypothetical protein